MPHRPNFTQANHFACTHAEGKLEACRRIHFLTHEELLRHAWELTRRVYGESLDSDIRMDRTVFSMRRQAS